MRYNSTERLGVIAVEEIFLRLGWIPRAVVQADVGLDMTVEICIRGNPTGQFFAVQIKTGESYFSETVGDSIIFRATATHVSYWINNSLPVLIVLHRPTTRETLWQVVTKSTIKKTGKLFKIAISKNNILQKDSLKILEQFASTPSPINTNFLDLSPFDFIAENKIILDIVNDKGDVVICEKVMALEFIKDSSSYIEELSADGDIEAFESSSGVIDTQRTEVGRTFIRNSFVRKMKKGENLELTHKWIYKNSFCGTREYLFIEHAYPCRYFSVNIIFPESRIFKEYEFLELAGYKEKKLSSVKDIIIDGRRAISAFMNVNEVNGKYRINWSW